MDFTGDKVAIVTGGAQGIGKAISKALLKSGLKVLICDINESSAKSFLEELPNDLKPNAAYQRCDVSSIKEMKSVFATAKSTFGRIDVVINNAGILNEIQWKKVIEVNFTGVIHGIHLAFDYMGKNKGRSGGFVINIASAAGLRGLDFAPIYSATKHAVVGLTRSFGTMYHLNKTGVRVNAVCPGPADTSAYYAFPALSLDEEKSKDFMSKCKPISPDEVANAVLKLLQDGTNGAIISVDDNGISYVDQS